MSIIIKNQSTEPDGEKPICDKCGATMQWKEGKSVNGNWRGYFCPNSYKFVNPEKRCKKSPIWFPHNDPNKIDWKDRYCDKIEEQGRKYGEPRGATYN